MTEKLGLLLGLQSDAAHRSSIQRFPGFLSANHDFQPQYCYIV